MRFAPTEIKGVVIVEPDVHRDRRGYFLETYHTTKYRRGGLDAIFLQDNQSASVRNTLRGLHMQVRKPQGKLVRVIDGEIWDVAVDLRLDSSTFGRWIGVTLSSENFRQIYVPEGCAHGFCVTSDRAVVDYKCTALYDPSDEIGIAYNDSDLAIAWPIDTPIVSERDARNLPLARLMERLTAPARVLSSNST